MHPFSFSPSDFTTWHNPLKVVQKCRIYISPGNYQTFEVGPGESKQLQSIFDQAIQEVNDDGVVVAGLGPMLQRVGGPPRRSARGKILEDDVRIHESLDPSNAERKSAQERLAELQLQELLADQELKIQRKRAEAAGLKAAADAAELEEEQTRPARAGKK